MPHSTLIRDWTSRDLSLAMADLLARDDIGPCGHPHSVTTKPGAADRYKVDDSAVCGACAQIEKHRAHDGDPKPGALLRVVDISGGDPDEETEFGPVFD
ncbi:MAG: hypothetical protein HOW59_37025 [Nonomuraea sp.]|nr:hypothetical protein [Nonomuraea sp.]NUQ31334.1 hypothetical protein [Dermatophilaceae bacterium]NUR81040.1 hypothetical protein [Dermatophilaceae bacterium]